MEDKDWQDMSHLPPAEEIEWNARFKKRITNFVTLFVGHQRPLHLQEGEIWLDPPAWSALKSFVQRYDLDPSVEEEDFVDVVFDGPPDAKSGRFVEVEDSKKRSVKIGRWIQRNNGQWALRIPLSAETAAPTPIIPNPTAEPLKSWEVNNNAWEAFAAEEHMTNGIQAAYEAGLRAHGLLSEGAPSEEQIARVRRMLKPFGLGDACTDRDLRQALAAAGVAPQEPSASDRDTWLCGKCEREKMLGRDDGQIAEHHRTCSVGMVPPPPSDREKLIAEATEFIDSWDRLGSWTPDSPIGMVMRLRNALAAPLDPVKVAEVLNRHEPIFKDGLYAGRCVCGFEHPSYSRWRLHRSGALCEAAKRGELS